MLKIRAVKPIAIGLVVAVGAEQIAEHKAIVLKIPLSAISVTASSSPSSHWQGVPNTVTGGFIRVTRFAPATTQSM
jgi:hypothetical protein